METNYDYDRKKRRERRVAIEKRSRRSIRQTLSLGLRPPSPLGKEHPKDVLNP